MSKRIMKSAKYKIYEDEKVVKKGKIRLFLPDYKNFGAFFKKMLEELPVDEQLYVCKMLQFHGKFPPDDIISSEYIDYTAMLEQEAIHKQEVCQNIELPLNELLYKSIYNDKIIELYMSEESYLNFKLSVLDEMDVVEADMEKMLQDCMAEGIQRLSFRKKVKWAFKRKERKDLEKEMRKEAYKVLNQGSKTVDEDLIQRRFYVEAEELLEHFNEKRYQKLITDLTDFFREEYEKGKKEYVREEMEYIASGKSREEKQDILIWIVENTSPRADAFDAMKLDAESIYLRCLHLFHVDYYKKNYRRMNPEERRMYQLLFFRRKSFLGRIPAFDKFFTSFWKNNLELIMEGLVVKNGNPSYREKNEELAEKWVEFINIYPTARKIKPMYDKLNDKEACLKVVDKALKGMDAKVIKAFLDGHEVQTICVAYDIEKEECEAIIQKFREAMARDEQEHA